jgi:predicted phage terminase large subunit-like protein
MDTAMRGIRLDESRPDLLIVDDIDEQHDTPATIQKKITTLTRAILPSGSPSMTVLGVQNIPNADGIFAQLVDGRAEFLLDRIVSGPHPALRDLPDRDWWERVIQPDGTPALRIVAGEPSWPGQGLAECSALLTKIGVAAFLVECQHQTDRLKGTLFQRDWFPIVTDWPRHARRVRFWDLAGTLPAPGADPDYTAGALVAEWCGQYTLLDMQHARLSPKGVEMLIRQTAGLDGPTVDIWFEQEPGSSGKALVDHYQRDVLKGFAVRALRSTGSKVERAKPASAAAEAGNLSLLHGPWNATFLAEAQAFPLGKHDDQVDALSAAVLILAGKKAPIVVAPGILAKGVA